MLIRVIGLLLAGIGAWLLLYSSVTGNATAAVAGIALLVIGIYLFIRGRL